MFADIALFILRLIVGLLFVGHGAQKLFGWFGGAGLEGVTGWLASMGLRPASFWAWTGALAEFGGGLLFALGLLNPLGALGISAAMLTVIITVHWQKGLWNSNGGIEFPLANLAAALAIALIGPGAYSLDAALGIALPQPITLIGGYALVILGILAMLVTQKRQPAQTHQPKAA